MTVVQKWGTPNGNDMKNDVEEVTPTSACGLQCKGNCKETGVDATSACGLQCKETGVYTSVQVLHTSVYGVC